MKALILAFIFPVFGMCHDFNMTHTTLVYNKSKESIEVTVNLVIEDLERALEEQGARNIGIGTLVESDVADELIGRYLNQRLKISLNNQSKEFIWVGKEVSDDLQELYIYFEVANFNKNGKNTMLTVENSVFTELLSDQVNIVLFFFLYIKRNFTFTNNRTRDSIELE